jgi:hypothetical protein
MAPTVSSVYSQATDWNPRPPVASSYYGEVSPPESPIEESRGRNSGNVSPVENDIERDIHPAFRIKQQKGSQLPVARKPAPNTSSPSRAYQRDPSQPTKWDKYSGEPTTSNRGMPHGVRPENVKESIESLKLRKAELTETPVNRAPKIDTRPAWKGASGRSAIVEPVKDKPGQKAPIPRPRREVRKPSPIITSSYAASPTLNSPKSTVADVEASHTPTSTIRPVPTYSQQPQSSSPLAEAPHLVQKTSHDTLKNIHSSNLENVGSKNAPDTRFGRAQDTMNGRPTDSRFSWTTQATNTTYQHSPPSSPPPPLPPMPSDQNSSPPAPVESIMHRSRPIPSSRNFSPSPDSPVTPTGPTSATTRKPLATLRDDGQDRKFPARKSSYAVSVASTTTNGGKALPRTPHELNSQDHVSILQAQMEDLTTQRTNLERVLRDLTAPGASNPLTTNFRVEREREKRIQAIRDELNDISLQEHDVGLKLHRAQRRREAEEGYEGFTTLWVRRVTS